MIISFVNSKVHQLFIYLTSKRYMNANQFIRGIQVVIFSDRIQQLSCPWSIIVLKMKNCFQQSILFPVSDFLLVAFQELHTFQAADIIQLSVPQGYWRGQARRSSSEQDFQPLLSVQEFISVRCIISALRGYYQKLYASKIFSKTASTNPIQGLNTQMNILT